MAVNRYTTVDWAAPTSSYIPKPFAEMMEVGKTMQKKYDTAIDDTYKLKDLMAKIPAIDDPQLGLSNVQKKAELDAKYHPKIDELSNKIASGDVNATRELEQIKRDFVNDPDRQELENSYLNYKTYKEDKIKKGGKYDPLLDDYYGQKLIGESGELKPFRYSGMEDSLDAPKRFKEIMGDIADDAKSWDIESLGKDGIKIGSKGKRAGVDETKVNKVVNNKVNLALNTDEGRQFVKRLKRIKPDITDDELLSETRKALFSSAYEQIGMDKMSGSSVSLTDMWSRNQDKQDQEASTAAEALNLETQELSKVMPEGLSKFYNGDKLNLMDTWSPGSKESGDRAAQSGGWLNLDMNEKNTSTQKTKEYINSLYDNASNILGLSKKEVADLYKTKESGYSWLKNTVEDYYKNLSTKKSTIATLQAPEQETATKFFLGLNVPDSDASSSIGSNIRRSEITDLNGNIKTDYEGINSNNYAVSSIGFEKPGQVVLSGNNGEQLYMNTNYESLKKITKPIVDLVKNATSFSKDFKLTEGQQQRLKSKTPLTSNLNVNGSNMNKTQFDKQQFNIGDNLYNIDAYIIRQDNGLPQEYYYVKEYNPTTKEVKESTLTEDQLKVKFANTVINSPEFRSINKQKETTVPFK
jgi:hypothetical protein